MDADALLRLACFLSILFLMLLWEWAAARRPRAYSTLRRWTRNFSLGLLGVLIIQILGRALPVAVAATAATWAETRGWGLFHTAGMGATAKLLGTLLVLDFAIYVQHVVFHKVPFLWRLHRDHHTDIDLDVSSALRFHPAEILFSMLFKTILVLLLGASPEGVVLFEILLNGMAMFNHANVRMPALLDRILRIAVVTPDMHRVHHSSDAAETDSNFGFNLALWDRIFRTYRAQPRLGHLGMQLGLKAYREAEVQNLPWLLTLPFGKRRDRE